MRVNFTDKKISASHQKRYSEPKIERQEESGERKEENCSLSIPNDTNIEEKPSFHSTGNTSDLELSQYNSEGENQDKEEDSENDSREDEHIEIDIEDLIGIEFTNRGHLKNEISPGLHFIEAK